MAPAPAALDARQVFLEHAGFVLRVVRRLGVAESDAEDVAQEVFLVVHNKLGTFTGESSVRTWLFGIAFRVASDHRRRAYVRRERPTAVLPVQTVEPNQPAQVRRNELLERLDRALDQLDDEKRAVFVLYELEGVPMAEIAQGQGCPLFTAYSRLREARARVRAAFAGDTAHGGER
jgi:RNA polymerase sigma-70 factor (ECF subfamily)